MYMQPNLAHTESMFTKAKLHLTMEPVRFQPATTHEAKCLFHDHAGRAGDQKKNYHQPDSHTIIHDIIPINTQSGKRKRRNENHKIESGLVFQCYVLLFILLVVNNFKLSVFLYFKPLLSGFGVGQLRRKWDHPFSCVHYTCLISLKCFMIFDLDLTDREKARWGCTSGSMSGINGSSLLSPFWLRWEVAAWDNI